jgi:chromate reductase
VDARPGVPGSARTQYHLRQTCVYLNMFWVNQPEVLIGGADTTFDAQGRLTDATTHKFIRQLLTALADGTYRLTAC